jgi:hypothetical protein
MTASELNRKLPLRFFERMPTKAIVGFILVVTFALLLLLAWQRWSSPAKPGDYEGRIVDRWADNSGAAENYQPRLYLVIETTNGKRVTVEVEPAVYESARVGMRIKSRSGQAVLIDSDRGLSGNK